MLLERYGEDIGGFSLVPYAIYAYGQVIRVFDQSIHQSLETDSDSNSVKDDMKRDRRWVTVKRPAIVLGAEMDREALDLGYDPTARFYQAPPHIKAINGALIIDDFGRQQIPTRDLLTRWLIPMERGWDSLTLATGEKLVVPFKVQLLFSTNMRVKQLADEALLRRILYKIQIPNPLQSNFAEILRQACRQKQIRAEDGALDYAVGVVVVAKASDIGAYFTGRLFGRHKLAPRISPGKTWEGTIGALIGGLIAVPLLNWPLDLPISTGEAILLGALLPPVAVLADLGESMLKRGAGVKDTSELVPGHGGFLDRLDSILFTVPLVYYFAIWVVL